MHWTLVSVETLPYRTRAVRFADGTEGKVRFESTHLEGVFAALKDSATFRQAPVEGGTVSWPSISWPGVSGPGEIDLAPNAMDEEIKRASEWVLR